jgi:glycerophosphoryl diester phosphodiesterase
MGRILNIAHRGFHLNFPENTLEAFEAAIRLGLDGIEMDVQETADNSFVVFHDDATEGMAIKKMALSQIMGISLDSACKIPTLEQVLDLCRKRVKILVDLKKVHSLVSLLVILKKEAGSESIIAVSFSKELISAISFLAPTFETALITAYSLPNPVKLAIAAGAKGIVARHPSVNLKLVEKARGSKLSIYAWGCADIKAAQKVMKLDVDGIITDFPDQVKRVLS